MLLSDVNQNKELKQKVKNVWDLIEKECMGCKFGFKDCLINEK
jgi:hypothetical protein